jgi:hypothetical protein
MEAYLKDMIEGRCQGVEQHVHEAEKCSEERLISLEMARAKAEVSQVDMEQQFGDLKLEVNRINRFIECENMGDPQGRPDIFGGGESQSVTTAVRGPAAVRDTLPRDRETRCADTQIHGMCHSNSTDSAHGR